MSMFALPGGHRLANLVLVKVADTILVSLPMDAGMVPWKRGRKDGKRGLEVCMYVHMVDSVGIHMCRRW